MYLPLPSAVQKKHICIQNTPEIRKTMLYILQSTFKAYLEGSLTFRRYRRIGTMIPPPLVHVR